MFTRIIYNLKTFKFSRVDTKLEDVYFWILKTNNVTNIVRNYDKNQVYWFGYTY